MTATPGVLIVVTGPSAVGKGAIVKALLDRTPEVRFSVSMTTRPKRPSETNGVEYWFVTREEFQAKIAGGELLEWAEVYGNYYGTPRAPVDAALAQGLGFILDIDIVGATAVRQHDPNAVSVFVIPPSLSELEHRIRKRGSESDEAVRRRLAEAPNWIKQGLTYDYVLVNDNLQVAVEQLRSIIHAELCRTKRGGGELIQRLLTKGELG